MFWKHRRAWLGSPRGFCVRCPNQDWGLTRVFDRGLIGLSLQGLVGTTQRWGHTPLWGFAWQGSLGPSLTASGRGSFWKGLGSLQKGFWRGSGPPPRGRARRRAGLVWQKYKYPEQEEFLRKVKQNHILEKYIDVSINQNHMIETILKKKEIKDPSTNLSYC